MADECDDLPWLGAKRDTVQHRAVRDVSEVDVAELHVAFERRAFAGCRFVGPGRRCIKQAEVAFRAGHREGGFGQLRSDDRDRREEQVGQEEERHEVAEARARAGKRCPAADADERSHEALCVEFEQR